MRPETFGIFAAKVAKYGVWRPVCTENLSSGVVVVKSAKDGVSFDASQRSEWRVTLERM